MSVQGTSITTPQAFQALQQQQGGVGASPPIRPPVFDSFQVVGAQPKADDGLFRLAKSLTFHPFKTLTALRKIPGAASEKKLARIQMYLELNKAMGRDGRTHLKNLMKAGVLNDDQTDDGHSTLYQLYAMLTTRRANGLDNKKLVNETVRILNRPYLITQKFGPLSETTGQQILQVRNNPTLTRAGEMPSFKPLSWEDLNVTSSATCVSSSVMYYMADKKPGELARHLNELTSPAAAFYEKVKLEELSPKNPQDAYRVLQENKIRYYRIAPDEVMVKVELPQAGLLRTINDSQQGIRTNVRTGIETAYQSALTYLATRSYDPATDMRDAEQPGETSKGLTEAENLLMERIIKDNGGVDSITYQVVGAKASPQPGEEGFPFLYGYSRTFEQTAQDLIQALQMGELIRIGITDTDDSGSIAGGHEIRIISAFVDKKDGELKFVVADSDDDIEAPVVRTARELIPRIHHAQLPIELADKIQAEIQQISPRYYIPNQSDTATFQPIPFVPEQLPADQVPNQQAAQQTAQDPTPQATSPGQPSPQAAPVSQVPQTAALQTPAATIPASRPAAPSQPQYVVDYVPVQTQPYYGWPSAYPGYGYANNPYTPLPNAYPAFPTAYGYPQAPMPPLSPVGSYAAYPPSTYGSPPKPGMFQAAAI